MPELGELQAHVERLDRDLAGAHLERFDVMVPPVLKTATPSPEVAYQHPVAFVGRRGLYLLVDFGIVTFVVGLGAHGRLGPDDDKREAPGVGVARWQFGDGRAWVLADTGPEPGVGLWVVLGNPEQQRPLAGLGPDANDVSPGQLFELLRSHPSILHDFLLDQQ